MVRWPNRELDLIGHALFRQQKYRMYLSGCPKTKTEAGRWLRRGIELTVIDPATNRPIKQKEGPVKVNGHGWTGTAVLVNGIVAKLQ
jgi:hypothetical protein